MVTTTSMLGLGETADTIMTNKGPQVVQNVPKKCVKCDETVVNEEKCPRCFSLTENAKLILND